MRRLIGLTFPAHGVIGEEYGHDRPDAEYVWVLDPIDGTKSFISGLPMWGTLIGLMHRGRPVYGMMSQPFTRERYSGDGKRSRWRGLALPRGDAAGGEWANRTLRTRACARLAEATLMTTSPLLFNDERPRRLSPGGGADAARALRRRLLRLLHARLGLRRSHRRSQSQAPRRRRARADHRRRGGRSSRPGRAGPLRRAAASSPRATLASMRRRSPC